MFYENRWACGTATKQKQNRMGWDKGYWTGTGFWGVLFFFFLRFQVVLSAVPSINADNSTVPSNV